ncbi:acetolactate synthase I/II/III large subunit [Agaricicola taiwanensis]|uniref:Acetolactate synthase I/II/III large subunit n=1 Tax=Agaricicola taiwanensis TaxID=591372 RepID=A0A8J2VMM7_9RHOB|nr:thiamine pyrophosphate-binding protein [Agaricicola taiwanensis]GGE32861.1 acetolactate synthase I/II/III large subunit [Agaricicola taiwanensis]
MKVYEAVAAAVVAEGCDSIFGLVGDANMGVWAAFGGMPGVTLYAARHEAAAVTMAEAHGRVTGGVGVATVTRGPGLTHTATSLVAAVKGHSPLVLIAGDIAPGSKNRHQDIDQRKFAEACNARFQQPSRPDTVLEDVREAFYIARTHRCPVVLNLPADIDERPYDRPWNYVPSTAFLPQQVTSPDAAAIATLADALMASERPVIIAGRGADRDAAKAIEQLADRAGALLATTLLAKGLFTGHPYDLGIAGGFANAPAERLMADADFVLSFGADLGYHTADGGKMFPKAEIARVDIRSSAESISLLPGRFVQGDAHATALALAHELELRQVQRSGYRTSETDEVLATDFGAFETPTDGLDPRLLMRRMSPALPDKVLVTCGIGHFFAFPAMYVELPPDGDMQFSHHFGAIGQGLPYAIGSCVAARNRPHVLIEGDGSLLQHLQELETVVREGLQLTVLVWNDAGYGAEVHKMRQKGLNPAFAQWTSPDFVGVARAFGGDGIVLDNEQQIKDALATGLSRGGLYVIDARVSPSTISDPYRRQHLGEDNRAPLLRSVAQP